MDSHIKPYVCKVALCGTTRFISTAALLRHEHEAHGPHGHGDKPFLCTYLDCERAVPGNGFPQQWNLQDHMKRVHNDVELDGHRLSLSQHSATEKSREWKNVIEIRKEAEDAYEKMVEDHRKRNEETKKEIERAKIAAKRVASKRINEVPT